MGFINVVSGVYEKKGVIRKVLGRNELVVVEGEHYYPIFRQSESKDLQDGNTVRFTEGRFTNGRCQSVALYVEKI